MILFLASTIAQDFVIPLITLGFLYLLHTTGELFLSPIGLSMVTKLAPKHMTATVMGAWFLSFSASDYTAAKLATLTGSIEQGSEGVIQVPAAESFTQFVDVYTTMGLTTIGIGLFLCLISKPLNKMMHGVT